MTTPHDARPELFIRSAHIKFSPIRYERFDSREHAEALCAIPLDRPQDILERYTAADYDALREEVYKLQLALSAASKMVTVKSAEYKAELAERIRTTVRAETAEAIATTAMNLTAQWRRRAHKLRYNPAAMPFAAECIEECAKQLSAVFERARG